MAEAIRDGRRVARGATTVGPGARSTDGSPSRRRPAPWPSTSIDEDLRSGILHRVARRPVRRASGGDRYLQEEDVLDTWFSAGLWPFSTLGWPDETDDLKALYPGAVLETGFDILFFWVARMMMFGCHFMGEGALQADIFLHAMVRDSARPQDVEVAGQRDRPARRGRTGIALGRADREDQDLPRAGEEPGGRF